MTRETTEFVSRQFTNADLLNYKRHQRRCAIAVMTLAVVTILGGSAMSSWLGPPKGIVWLVGGIAGFIAGLLVISWLAPPIVWKCPWCAGSLANRMNWVEKSRSCPHCGQRVIDRGKQRESAVMKRHFLQQQSAVVAKGLWAPIVFGCFFLLMDLVLPSRHAGPDHIVLLFPAMSLAAVWAYARSGDSRLMLPAVMSVVLVVTSLSFYLFDRL